MTKRRAFSPLLLPAIPAGNSELQRWSQSMSKEIQRFANDVKEIGADYDLISNVTGQTLTTGFTIEPDSHEIEIQAASDIVSDATTAIKNGRNGQTIVLTNIAASLITIKDLANTRLGEDVTLALYDSLTLKWSTTLEEWLSLGVGRSPVVRGKIAVGVGNVGTGEDTLWTWTMPANSMVANSMMSVSAIAGCPTNANIKTLKFHLGGSSLVLNQTTAVPSNVNIIIDIKLWYQNNTSVLGTAIVYMQATGVAVGTAELILGFVFSTSIDFTTALVVKFTGEAVSDNDIVLNRASILIHRIF